MIDQNEITLSEQETNYFFECADVMKTHAYTPRPCDTQRLAKTFIEIDKIEGSEICG
jgi:hypothetical protein